MARQELRLLPQMLQSIEVLQLATQDLLELVAQEVAGNEVLEVRPADVELPVPAAAEVQALPWSAPREASGDGDDRRAFLENQPAPVGSLLGHVGEQVAFLELPEPLAGAVVAVAGLLDDRGLLAVAPGELPAATGLQAELADEALAVLRTLEPLGLGACTGVEAMLMQALGDPDFATIRRLLTEHLEALARNKLPEVARAVQLSVDELTRLLERVRELDPSPGRAFHDEPVPAIRPDASAWLQDGEVRVALAEDRLPWLGIDAGYQALLTAAGTERPVRDYLRQKVQQARALIDAIEQRQVTLLRVVEAVMRRQRDYLAGGRGALRPLRMREIADELGLHESTISRAIAGKYVATGPGLVRLRDFFDGGRAGAAPEAGQARGAVVQRIAELLAREDARAPLSDEAVVEALAAQGIELARRTVTKIRRELGIPSSYRRRRHEGRP